MDLENGDTADLVRAIDQNLAIEPPGSEQGWIENLGPVRRSQQHYTCLRIESVQLHQELVQSLLFFIISASYRADAAGPSQGIQFVDENDARRDLSGLLEQIANSCGADADKHFDEFRSADRKEWHTRFPGDRASEQRLSVPGGPTSSTPFGMRAPSRA